ncbi:MAG: Outer-membrane lipoprotein carrier protein [Alphaproteobacteria bacterium MarineAlpha6_Bin4]|nr:MAG: Outer-membrane lipoprotein carrier protein [Alphaproteobacteria bacterium MarineAlpha6_Bin4]
MKKIVLYSFLIFFSFSQKKIFSLDDQLIYQLENYLNKFNNISSQFIQSSPNGKQESGIILISKPGKLRIEYKNDSKLLIIADGKWLHYFDIDLNEIQSVVIEKSPAWILLKGKINLKKDFNVQKLSKNKGKITLTLTDKNIENFKKVELIFSSTPLKLKKWIITDNQEGETIVALINTKKVKRFSSKTFKLIEN